MTRRVFLHIGLPKTGTTYLQSILWKHRDLLRDRGLLLPGSRREHLWASGDVRGERRLERRSADAPGSWGRLVDEIADWSGDALVTHEFFCGASAAQVGTALTRLADARPDEVHVVVTAREMVSLVTARWQEWVKNGATGDIDSYPPREGVDPTDEWGWATLDLGEILTRWSTHVPPERIHVLCPPAPGEPEAALWDRFAGVLGLDASGVDTGSARQNRSLGLVAVELMRRVNGHVSVSSPADRGTWLRGYLGQGVLAGLDQERFWPGAQRVDQLRERGDAALTVLRGGGYDVVGDLAVLETPLPLEERRHPAQVGDDELVEVAARAMAQMMGDVREARTSEPDPGPDGASERLVTLVRRARNRRRTRR